MFCARNDWKLETCVFETLERDGHTKKGTEILCPLFWYFTQSQGGPQQQRIQLHTRIDHNYGNSRRITRGRSYRDTALTMRSPSFLLSAALLIGGAVDVLGGVSCVRLFGTLLFSGITVCVVRSTRSLLVLLIARPAHTECFDQPGPHPKNISGIIVSECFQYQFMSRSCVGTTANETPGAHLSLSSVLMFWRHVWVPQWSCVP